MTKDRSGQEKPGVMPRSVGRNVGQRGPTTSGIRLPKPTTGKCKDVVCCVCGDPIPPARRAVLADCIGAECTGNCRTMPTDSCLCVECKSRREQEAEQRKNAFLVGRRPGRLSDGSAGRNPGRLSDGDD